MSDLEVEFRVSPTRPMVELSAIYEDGDFHFASPVNPSRLQGARVKVVVRIAQGLHEALSRTNRSGCESACWKRIPQSSR